MSSQRHSPKSASCSTSLTVPELEQSKITVLNMLASAHSRRSYKHAIESSSPGIVLSLDWASTVPSWCDTGRSLRGALCQQLRSIFIFARFGGWQMKPRRAVG